MTTEGVRSRNGVPFMALFIAVVAVVTLIVLPYIGLPNAPDVLTSGLVILFVLSGIWVVLRVMGQLFERITTPKFSHAQARSVWRLVSYVVLGVVLLGLGLGLIVDVTSTALSVGLVGAALAFVLQKPLLNLVGWVLVTYRQVYRIGDRIEVGDVRGYVTDIGLMYTELQEFGKWMKGDTFTGRIVTIPNGAVVDGPTFNYTRDFPFVWDEVEVMVTYESDIAVAKTHMISAAMEVVGGIMFENYEQYRDHLSIQDLEGSLLRTPEIRMEFADSGVRLFVLYFCPAERRRKLRAQLVEKVWHRFSTDTRVAIAYPHVEFVPYGASRRLATELQPEAAIPVPKLPKPGR